MLECFKDFKNQQTFDSDGVSGLNVIMTDDNLSPVIQGLAKGGNCSQS